MKIYQVGGAVRDEILGKPSKDIDFVCVLEDELMDIGHIISSYGDPFTVMVNELRGLGFKIFLKSPEYLTVRAQFPDKPVIVPGITFNFHSPRLTADFVLARKESGYTDGRRPDTVEVGTLEDDLARRDFTMNAIAKDAEGNLIDPHNGVQDINDRVIRAVGNAWDRLNEDALRAVRALRFSVTTGFRIDHELRFAMQSAAVLDKIRNNISDERIREELTKMFKHDTLSALAALHAYPALTGAMFDGRVSLEPTMKQRARRAGRKIDMSARSTGVQYHYPDNNGG